MCFCCAALLGAPLDVRTAAWGVVAATVAFLPAASVVGTPRGTARALGLWPLVAAACLGDDPLPRASGRRKVWGGDDGGWESDGEGGGGGGDGDGDGHNAGVVVEALPLFMPAALALGGAWAGAILLPLDWGTVWQVWPLASTWGTIAGAGLGFSMIFIIKCFFGAKNVN